ncbi:MAG: putative Tungsten-containing formylmethanofuran dehydrogenase 2 subunit B [Promethearchaeota archaeon]|nr:MAG: putative Tungsten-containing formylmethanofuran dehydrogenase 2 subunit B [Candidatus Lokiarchaeota archaeon]
MEKIPCAGCSLLCDDLLIEKGKIDAEEVVGACLKGKERFEQVNSENRILNPQKRRRGELQSLSWDDAIKESVKILRNSENPLLYGFSNSSCEAQAKGIELAREIDGFIDSNSTICQGRVLNAAKKKGLALSTITEMINKADVLIFWGFNAAESIPRLLNKTLFSRGKFRMTGREIKTIIIIDPVKTASYNVLGAKDVALQIEAGKDLELIRALKEKCCQISDFSNQGVAGLDEADMDRLLTNISNAENATILVGQGLLRPEKEETLLKELLELVEIINLRQEKGRVSICLAGGHSNMFGFEHAALCLTGKNQSIQFKNKKIVQTKENILTKIEKEDFDCSIIVGTDPISHLPVQLSTKLASEPMILIDSKETASTMVANIILPTALTGIECEGTAIRLDHVPIALKKIVEPKSGVLSDKEVMEKIIQKLKEDE